METIQKEVWGIWVFKVLCRPATIWTALWRKMVPRGCLQIFKHRRYSSWCSEIDVTGNSQLYPSQRKLCRWCTGWWCLSLTISLSSTFPSSISLPIFYFSHYVKTIRKFFPYSKVPILLREPIACVRLESVMAPYCLPSGLCLTSFPHQTFQAHFSTTMVMLPRLPCFSSYQFIPLLCPSRFCSHLTS